MKNLLLLFTILCSGLFAQNFEYDTSFGDFKNASSFYITANGMIYVSDSGSDEIVLLDTLGNQLKTFGGYGWDENSFDNPTDVFADPLTIYVADKNNHAIKRFDKNLNYLSSLYKKESDNSEERFGYPLSCATSNQGDLYFIDSENSRIMKFDLYGNYKINFGGFDAGKYQLSDPTKLAISSSNNIFVIDGEDIIVYDDFGNGINRINIGQRINSIRILFDQLVLTINDEIYHIYLRSPDLNITKFNLSGIDVLTNIVSAILLNNNLYVLTSKDILIFNKVD
ncbi:MAG: NHL repeat-containing protein [Ignavibacteriales bacterium]|nr:NHL repeat-containing protein [Ignavibacteriales bacterium]